MLSEKHEVIMASWTKTEAFAALGATLTNVRWSWSARTPGGVVVMTLWADRLSGKTSPVSYDGFSGEHDIKWRDRPGNQERLDNLIWARDNCNGLFRVVMVRAKMPIGDPREIEEAYPKPGMIMRLTELNEQTGEFRAVLAQETI